MEEDSSVSLEKETVKPQTPEEPNVSSSGAPGAFVMVAEVSQDLAKSQKREDEDPKGESKATWETALLFNSQVENIFTSSQESKAISVSNLQLLSIN